MSLFPEKKKRPTIALTVDVEDYFQATAFEKELPRVIWEKLPSRVEKNTILVLDLFSEFELNGTFFILGWVASKFPNLVKEIQYRGHEIASHGYDHRLVYKQGGDKFREDIKRSKGVLESISGVEVAGYRAPTFSITARTPWAHGILAEEGYRYSSSVFPVRHDRYGWPDFPKDPAKISLESGKTIWEFPLSTINFGPLSLPFGGGGYLRIYPYWLSKLFFTISCKKSAGFPIIYFHPWEIDFEQPHLPNGILSRIRHSYGLVKFESKLRSIFNDNDFQPMVRFLQ